MSGQFFHAWYTSKWILICQTADQTPYSVYAGDGLLGIHTLANSTIRLRLDYSKIQKPLSPVRCSPGAYLTALSSNGTFECSPASNTGGDITSVAVGHGLTSVNATQGDVAINVDYNIVQARVASVCSSGSSIREIRADGTVSCELDNDSGGDLTSISVSNGLTGGGQVGDLSANTSYLQKRIIEQCNTGEYIRGINEDGSIVCEADRDSGGDITSVTAGNGIVGSASNGDVSLSINTSTVQKRVVGGCAPGASIREIKIDGTVVCEVDDNSDVPADAVLAVGGQNGVYVDRINMSKVIVFANTSYLQKRVQGHCSAGEAINQIFDDGSIQCESMPVYTMNTTDIRMQINATK